MKKLLLVVLAIVLSACAGVANAGEPKSEVEQAREKWQAANISHYRFNVHISCFCVFVENMPLVVEVKDGEVVSMEFATGNEIDPQLLPLFERYVTIDRLFDGLESGFDFEGDDSEPDYEAETAYQFEDDMPRVESVQVDAEFAEGLNWDAENAAQVGICLPVGTFLNLFL